MKREKKRFIKYFNRLVNQEQDISLSITINIFFDKDRQEGYLTIDSNKETFCKEFLLPIQGITVDKKNLSIGENSFSAEGMLLNLKDEENRIQGEVHFSEQKVIHTSFWQDGIMGPFRKMPFLQSYYDVLSLSHQLEGKIYINNTLIELTNGKGYTEEAWGKTYPKIWIRAQCNHFENHDVALMIGIARMPILFDYRTCFAIPVFYKGTVEVFSNYNRGQIAKLYRYKEYIHLIIIQESKVLDLKIFGNNEMELMMPKGGHAIKDIFRCETAKVELKIIQNSHVVLEDIGNFCYLEMGGNTSKLK